MGIESNVSDGGGGPGPGGGGGMNVSSKVSVRDAYLAQIEVTMLSVMFTVTVIGNGLALTALGARKRRQLTRMHYFILHLCISDLTVAFFNILPQLIMDVTGRFVGGYPGDNFLCKFVKFMQWMGPSLSVYVLVVTAIDRYQAICFPMMNCSWTPRRSKIMIGCAWSISVLCSVPQLLIFSYQRAEPYPYHDCWATFVQPWGEQTYVMWNTVVIFFVPLLILIITYTCICRAIWVNFRQTNGDVVRHSKTNGHTTLLLQPPKYNQQTKCNNLRKLSDVDDDDETSVIVLNSSRNTSDCPPPQSLPLPPPQSESTRVRPPVHPIRSHTSVTRISRAKMKTVKLTVAVILCYVACSLPFFSSMIYAKWISADSDPSFFSSYAFTILSLLVSLNSCVNPWLYLIFNENLALTLKDLVRCRLKSSQGLNGGHVGVIASHSSLSESRLPTVLTLTRPINNHHQHQQQQVNVMEMKTMDNDVKHNNYEVKIKNCNKITFPGHKCEDNVVHNNCEQV